MQTCWLQMQVIWACTSKWHKAFKKEEKMLFFHMIILLMLNVNLYHQWSNISVCQRAECIYRQAIRWKEMVCGTVQITNNKLRADLSD